MSGPETRFLTRRRVIAAAAAGLLMPATANAQTESAQTPSAQRGDEDERVLSAVQSFVFGSSTEISAALSFLSRRGRPDVASSLIFALRYTRYPGREILDLLEQLTGAAPGRRWADWMLWQEATPDLPSHPAFYTFKRSVFMLIDPDWRPFLEPRFIAAGAMDVRFEEVVWGGVRRDGIPSLDNPDLVPASLAGYLRDADPVFGVEIDGDARAYPLRIMGWHEMFNDVIGGVPVALAYCTLCGAGILFETTVEGRAEPFAMATSGFLYRSNKLMYDRQTESLWNQFTGEPVSGALRGSGIALRQRPVVIEPWGRWRARHPSTRVLSLDTGYDRDYGSGVVYRDYFASADLMFPVRVDQSRLRQKDYVFAIRRFAAAQAWALELFAGGAVVNDTVGDVPVVLIGDAAGRTVRAYERGEREFSMTEGGEVTSGDAVWSVGEAALTAPSGASLPRVAGHVAYWFAWNSYLGPEGEVVTR